MEKAVIQKAQGSDGPRCSFCGKGAKEVTRIFVPNRKIRRNSPAIIGALRYVSISSWKHNSVPPLSRRVSSPPRRGGIYEIYLTNRQTCFT